MTFISSSTAPGPALGYHRHALYAWEPPLNPPRHVCAADRRFLLYTYLVREEGGEKRLRLLKRVMKWSLYPRQQGCQPPPRSWYVLAFGETVSRARAYRFKS